MSLVPTSTPSRVLAVVAALFFFATSEISRADEGDTKDEKEECASSYENAQKLRREGKLSDARKELVHCGSATCPALLTPYCVQWLREVDASLPSVVVVARDPKGAETDDVRVFLDGQLATSRLDGRPISLDPGKHHFRYEHDGSPILEEDVFMHTGEQNRRLELSFKAFPVIATPWVPPPPEPFPAWPLYTAFGMGIAGIGVGAVMGGLALSTKSSLDDSCHPKGNCPANAQGDIDNLATYSTASTIGFIVGGVGVGAGLVLLIVRGVQKPAPHRASFIEPWISPTAAGVRGTF
jgi:hypothetical protein